MRKKWDPPNGGNGRGKNGAIAPGEYYDDGQPTPKKRKKKAVKSDPDQDGQPKND